MFSCQTEWRYCTSRECENGITGHGVRLCRYRPLDKRKGLREYRITVHRMLTNKTLPVRLASVCCFLQRHPISSKRLASMYQSPVPTESTLLSWRNVHIWIMCNDNVSYRTSFLILPNECDIVLEMHYPIAIPQCWHKIPCLKKISPDNMLHTPVNYRYIDRLIMINR